MSSDTRPKWQQVLDDLEVRLADGEISGRFPTDRELVEHYGVSRHTVREAVRRLKARGVVERARGRGSTVTGAELLQPLGTLYSLFRAVQASGMSQLSETLALDLRVDPEAATKLGVDPDEPVFHLERIRHAGDAPLALDTVWLRADRGRGLLDVDFSHTALYDELERIGIERPVSGTEVITPIVPDDDLREVLDLDADEAVLRVERTGVVGDEVVECRVTLLRGSRFSLVSKWPDGGAVAPSLT